MNVAQHCRDCGEPIKWEPFVQAWLHTDESIGHDGVPAVPVQACTPADRMQIIRHVYDAVIHETETFHGAVGGSLAYLLAAIGGAHTHCTFRERSGIVRILRKHFASTEPVWRFIEIESPK